MRALEGIVILDLTHVLSGPYCTMLLADLGARAIKIEPPGKGEATRQLLRDTPEYSRDGLGPYFLTLCRNKESVAIDLKQPAGLSLFHDLVQKADVVVSNFGAGVTKRLRIDYPRLSELNPRIITCTISGFGETGPFPNRPAFDLVAQAMGGGMTLTGHADGESLRAGIPIGDLASGLFATVGILSALQARERTGVGQNVDISMLDCQLSLLNYMATMYFMSGKSPGRCGNGHFVHVPYNTFRTQTGDIVLAIVSDDSWLSLTAFLNDEALKNPAFSAQPGRLANRAFVEGRVQAILATKPCEHWLEIFARARIPAAPVNEIADAFADPQILARNMKVNVPLPGGGYLEQPGNPVKLSGAPADDFRCPPRLGEHTGLVLREFLDLGSDRIAALSQAGVVDLGS
jgi:crotonobetainyl-CoA:carnitine CoA-transferase CaiB-like acyl-CoA transferase